MNRTAVYQLAEKRVLKELKELKPKIDQREWLLLKELTDDSTRFLKEVDKN